MRTTAKATTTIRLSIMIITVYKSGNMPLFALHVKCKQVVFFVCYFENFNKESGILAPEQATIGEIGAP